MSMLAQLLLVSILTSGSSLQHGATVASPAAGHIRGFQENVLDKNINVYLGIPFAKPPTDDRRFKRPEPAEPWTGVYEATEFPPACAGYSFGVLSVYENDIFRMTPGREDEDCLYLNIWAPKNGDQVPVMVFIHGGANVEGHTATPLYNGKALTASQDIIVVTIQYRLTVFGFLYSGTEDAPGNMGLLDQHMAIKWVHDNIREFGGDPERITILGESAGGGNAQLQALSDLPKYFKNAAMHSASHLDLFSYHPPDEALDAGNSVIETLGCNDKTIPDSIQCLRKLNASFICEKIRPAVAKVRSTVDNYFFTKPPAENYPGVGNVSFIIGTNENEGYLRVLSVYPPLRGERTRPLTSEDDYNKISSTISGAKAPIKGEETLAKVQKHYLRNVGGDYLDKLDAMFGDLFFTCPAVHMAERFAEAGNVYMYRLKHRSSACMFPEWQGAAHICDVDLVFGLPLIHPSPPYTHQDVAVSRTMLDFWGNFIRTGNPNRRSLDDGDDDVDDDTNQAWPRYTKLNKRYLILDTPNTSVETGLRRKNCLFWENLKAEKTTSQKRDEF